MKNRLELDKMLNSSEVVQTTDKIRELRHSSQIRRDVRTISLLEQKYSRLNKDMLLKMAQKQANFLYTHYTLIFNKLVNHELNVNILFNFINVLEQIECGELNQHEGSQQVGQILKELYIDGVINKKEKTKKDLSETNKKKDKSKKPKKISYKQFKLMNS